MGKISDLTGMKFHRLTAIGVAGRSIDRQVLWNCVCECGAQKIVAGGHLRSGHTKSCGCFNLESVAIRSVTHGMSNTSTMSVWQNMMNRCFNKNVPAYQDYGARGITVCDRWKDFNLFLMDMGIRPDDRFLERIDNDKGYSPENCKWATRAEQARNTRRNRLLTIDGETLVMADWAKKAGIKQSSFTYLVDKGVNPKDVISQSAMRRAA